MPLSTVKEFGLNSLEIAHTSFGFTGIDSVGATPETEGACTTVELPGKAGDGIDAGTTVELFGKANGAAVELLCWVIVGCANDG